MGARRILGVMVMAGLLAGLGAQATSADPLTVLGSLVVTKGDGGVLTTELTGFAVIANPGLEKTITQQLPPFTLPVFVDGDTASQPSVPGVPRLLRRNFDTTLVLTNTTASSLAIRLTLLGGGGAPLGPPVSRSLAAHETILLLVSDLLP